MNDYLILTDSACDIGRDMLSSWGIGCIDLSYRSAGKTDVPVSGDMPLSEFYAAMRGGAVFHTSAINLNEYKNAFREKLGQGKDIVYIGLSSGISITSNIAKLAAQELAEEFPNRKIYVMDSLCGSGGQGMLLYLAAKKKDEGASAEELLVYLSETAPKICHWFTVDDLKYLKRGGRISAADAFAATVLDIKPVMHVDESGHLVGLSKVRGRRQSVKALAEKYQTLAEDPEKGIYFISHGDCLDDAIRLESIINEKCGHKAEYITQIGPVIGSHSGPGTLALFFIGKQR